MTDSGDRYILVSSDCHAGADVQDYKPYLESKWHEEFDAWASTYRDKWNEIDPGSTAATAPGQEAGRAGVASGVVTTNWDSDRRLQDLEADGVVGEVVFPNTAPPFFPSGNLTAATPKTRDEYEHRWAGLKAHNRWMVDFCAQAPGRRAGIAQILLNDVDDAVAEIEWIREAGLTGGVLIPIVEPTAPIAPVFTHDYERIWAACADLDIPANQHSTAGGLYTEYIDTPGGMAAVWVEAPFWAHRSLWHMIFGGVFERHSRLKYVMTEQGAGWVAPTLQMLDAFHTMGQVEGPVRAFFEPSVKELPLTPSEYFARNCWLGATLMSRDEMATGIVERYCDRIMWGTDYPHSEGTFPWTKETLRATFFDRSESEVRAMLGENAIKLYNLDRAALRAAANRVGPRVEEVAQALDAARTEALQLMPTQ